MTTRASALVCLIALYQVAPAASTPLGAQSTREVSVEAGAADVQQTGRTAHDAAVLMTAAFREASPRFAYLIAGAFTKANDSVSAAQVALAAAWRATATSAWQTEGGATIAAFGATPFARGGSLSGFARERYSVGAGGFWAGGALGSTSRDNLASHSTAVELGGSFRAGEFDASMSVGRLRSNDFALFEAAGVFVVPGGVTYDLTDAIADLRYEHGPIVIDASQSWRTGARTTSGTESAFYISAVYTFSPRLAFSLATGHLLADPVRGIPDVQIISAILRLSLMPVRADATMANTARARSTANLSPNANGAVLRVHVVTDESSTVEVAGSFSNWRPVPLTRTSVGYEATIRLTPGTHKVAVRFNGGPWMAPGGTAPVHDDYGGEVGLVVVP
jgi:hypothetical protein